MKSELLKFHDFFQPKKSEKFSREIKVVKSLKPQNFYEFFPQKKKNKLEKIEKKNSREIKVDQS